MSKVKRSSDMTRNECAANSLRNVIDDVTGAQLLNDLHVAVLRNAAEALEAEMHRLPPGWEWRGKYATCISTGYQRCDGDQADTAKSVWKDWGTLAEGAVDLVSRIWKAGRVECEVGIFEWSQDNDDLPDGPFVALHNLLESLETENGASEGPTS